MAPTWMWLLGSLGTEVSFIITDKRGRVPRASACHSHLPAPSRGECKEPGLVTGAFAVVAENFILGTVHFAAAVVWQRGGVRADWGLRWI